MDKYNEVSLWPVTVILDLVHPSKGYNLPMLLKSDTALLNGRGSNAVYDIGKHKAVYTTASAAYG